jgi:glycosyltransferase involved in cell wall biosynthesis
MDNPSSIDASVTGHMEHPFISIILPALDEEKNIGKVVSEIVSVMTSHRLHFEVIVIDDGSTDETYDEALRWGAVVLSNNRTCGKGYCLRRGLVKARGDVIVTMDSDGEHLPNDIIRLLRYLFKGADVVAGSRFMDGSKNFHSQIHLFGNHLFNFAIRILTGKYVTDSQTGFRVLKRKVVDSLNLQSDGYDIEAEITVKSLRNGFAFKEVPISIKWREYGISRIRMLSDGRKILKTIIASSLSEVVHKR